MSLISGSWATTDDVLAVTGATVNDDVLTQAQGVIDVYSNVTIESSGAFSARDIRLLGLALCYQVAWQVNQVDIFTRTDVISVTQDGLSFNPANPEALELAPLAKRCLDRLSWRKPRSLRVRSSTDPIYPRIEDVEAAWLRDEGPFNTGWEQGWTE
jgi:hypothetical protein